MMLVKLYHSRPLLPWQRNLENLKPKVGLHKRYRHVLASNRVFFARNDEQSQITVVSDVSDDTDVFVLVVHYYHTLNFKNYVIRAN